MDSFRRIALLMALAACAATGLQAQSSSSVVPTQPNATAPALSVQARIRARREQRRAAAIHDAYSHRYETFMGMDYMRMVPGPKQQRVTMYGWDMGVTRNYNERLGVTVDGRGYFGTAYVGLNSYALTRPAISTYAVQAGPTYRFYAQPKYSFSGRVMAGYAYGNFSADTNGYGTQKLGLYPDGSSYALSASVGAEYNLTPTVSFKLSPEYFVTGFGSTTQANRGFSTSISYRFGK
ncbi:outer membrane protein [Telmatobacter bradus]|uniref:outer membrane protein n=1 Tax=Telmatobacter bradus TaxID=474953 RepID=UPI003B437BBB